MGARLVYVIGPSGVGKDSVLGGLRATWPASVAAHWARRTIARPSTADGEAHEPVDADAFERLRADGAFALHWLANGLCYGVRWCELEPLDLGQWVFVNGSRGYLPQLLCHWPAATVVHIEASPAVLRQRLLARGRETPAAVAERLQRDPPLQLPVGSICIQNDGALSAAVDELRARLLG
ncbi:MAG: phosphonate metabolism protein/1,5-bisphosphokinase (PRPP-forming) PhnN [Serpentinimonas sp.]|nr:phosphonate metabolism protein/1,5-bisphosphokinase (PRPP-forming) PhnN [Serpentinimonas sp.]